MVSIECDCLVVYSVNLYRNWSAHCILEVNLHSNLNVLSTWHLVDWEAYHCVRIVLTICKVRCE